MASRKGNRDEHRRQRKRMKEIRKEREHSRQQQTPVWAINSPLTTPGLQVFAAPSIEAAGSFQNALRLGIISGSPEVIAELRSLTPVSRGGDLRRPDAERIWQQAVNDGLRAQGKSLNAIKRLVALLSRQD